MCGNINPVDAFLNVGTGGIYGALDAVSRAAGGGGAMRDFHEDLTMAGSAGTIDLEKERFNVPFSSAQVRNQARADANLLTGGNYRQEINNGIDSPEGRMAGTYGAMLEGAIVGGAAGPALGAGSGFSGTGAMLGASGVGLGNQIAGGFGGEGAAPVNAFPSQGPTPSGGLNAAQLASLSAMNSQAHKGLAPTFESRMAGKNPGPGIAGDYYTA